ncbi:MAG TPA: hypothetical protein VFB14_00475 [Bryobacteraceae bacterium]|jgi:hypothetical protein|nr:hypothetical protein [Bryobacteraceae bacterium]
MALFTDASVVTLDDLLQYETSLVEVASSHGINVDTKIQLALSSVGDKLMVWLLKVSASDPQWLNRRRLGLATVVVTSTLQKWLCFEALSRFFAEAYNVQLNTRFQGKWTEYQQQASEAADTFFMSGLGIVYQPLPKPAMPLVAIQAGSVPAEAMFVQTAWVDARGNEGALSPVNGVILDGASTIAVAMAEGAVSAPAAAAGWNVYASTTDTGLTRQNNAPLSIGSTWQLPVSGLIAGAAPLNGQQPDYYVQLSRQLQRG